MKSRSVVVAALAEHPLLAGLDAAARVEIVDAGLIEDFAPGAVLSRDGEPALHYWLLCRGSVRVFYRSPEGNEIVVKVFHAPAAWAEVEVLTGQCHIEDCAAVDRATTLKIPRVAFERLLDAHPRFMKSVLLDTCARFFIAAQNERALAFLPVARRLANLLLSYVRVYGIPVEGGTGLRVRVSQADLANGLGVAKKSITRTLAAWRADGVLAPTSARIVIADLHALIERSAQDLIGVDWIAGQRLDDGRGARRRV